LAITDTLKWRAIYNEDPNNPEYLDEIDQNGKENLFKDIDIKRTKAIELINEKKIPIFKVSLGDGKRLIFTRRKMKTQGRRVIERESKDPKTGQIKKVKIPVPVNSNQMIIIIGWQKNVNGTNVKAINYIYPDGRIELGSEWGKDAIHKEVSLVKAHENQK